MTQMSFRTSRTLDMTLDKFMIVASTEVDVIKLRSIADTACFNNT